MRGPDGRMWHEIGCQTDASSVLGDCRQALSGNMTLPMPRVQGGKC